MKHYITIDGGTTNTRLYLTENDNVIGERRLSFGVRLGGGEPNRYKNAIRDAVKELLDESRLAESDISRILASGMITSEKGLCPLPHTTAPAGIPELHGAMHEVMLPEISQIPFVFLRGVKTGSCELARADMMRGEETELMGLTDGLIPSCLYVLPGSHSKIIITDSEGRISDFTTTLTGEMLASLSEHTVLADSVKLGDAELDEDSLLNGYRLAEQAGINAALFKVRILANLLGADKNAVYSFFCGAVLAGEIAYIADRAEREVVLAGKRQIREAMAVLLRALGTKRVTVADEETVSRSTVRGAIRIYENR